MNSPAIKPVLWSKEDAERLREFSETPLGRRLFDALRVEPNSTIPAGGSAKTQLGIIEGWRMAHAFLISLTISPDEEVAPESGGNYPALPAEN